jgi:hypothetical protein
MLRDLVQEIRHGKVTAEAFRDAERYLYGRAIEAEIWGTRFADISVRDALTQTDSAINKGLIYASDIVNNLGKVTSTLNMLPKMTDSMYRDLRTGFLTDAVDWAAGKEFGKVRNPFSKTKLKGAYINDDMAQTIKENLTAAIQRDKDGNIVSFDMESWMKKDPISYFKFLNLGQQHAERALISGTRQGNKNFLKNQNWFTRMLFQFKDYNLRAINAQTMRALTTRELDDGIALGMSIATNIGAYALRIGAKAASMYALGNVTGANDYLERMLDNGQLMRIAGTRSAFSGPLSFMNDAYEVAFGAPTIRTTVERQGARTKERTDSDILGDLVSQLPAMKEAFGIPYSAAMAMGHLVEGDAAQRDLKSLYKALPIPNFIPFMTYIDHIIGGSGFPEKRPKN